MSDLIVVTYADQFRAEEVRLSLARLQVEHLIDLEDICCVNKDIEGKVKLHQSVHLTAASAVNGGFWGLLIGMLFMNPLLGGLIGAGAGAISGSTVDYGISDDFIRELADQMQTNSSAIFILVKKITPDKVLDALSKYGGTVMKTSFPKDMEAEWQRALKEGNTYIV